MKKFKNLEDLWQHIKKAVPNGVTVTSVEKSPQQKRFYVTVPKALVNVTPKSDYELVFMETGDELEVFVEPTNDSFSVFDTEDLAEVMPIKLKESMNEAAVYASTKSDIPGWDEKLLFDYHSGRAELEKEIKKAIGPNVKFLLTPYPGGEFELYCKKKDLQGFISVITQCLSESLNESATIVARELKRIPKEAKSFIEQNIPGATKYYVVGTAAGPRIFNATVDLSNKSKQISSMRGEMGDYVAYESPNGMRFVAYYEAYSLGRFYFGQEKINETLKNEHMNESEAQDKYREFFENKLKQYNVSSPAELSQEQKSKFFQEVKTEWAEEKKKQGINEAFTAREMSSDMISDYDSAEQKFIKENIPGIKTWYQVYRGKALGAAVALEKKSKKVAEANIAGGRYVAFESPKGLRFVGFSDGFGGECYYFGEKKINENYMTEAEVMKGTGKLYITEETAGAMSGDELVNTLKNLSDTMAQLSTDPAEDSVKAYKECEDSYQCLKAELKKRGLDTVN